MEATFYIIILLHSIEKNPEEIIAPNWLFDAILFNSCKLFQDTIESIMKVNQYEESQE